MCRTHENNDLSNDDNVVDEPGVEQQEENDDDDDLLFRKTKRFKGSENVTEKINKDGVIGPTPEMKSYILIDDDAPEVSVSPDKYDDVAVVHEIGQDKFVPDITKEASFPVLDSQQGNFVF